jgi:hypothetical protein
VDAWRCDRTRSHSADDSSIADALGGYAPTSRANGVAMPDARLPRAERDCRTWRQRIEHVLAIQ